MTNVFNKRIGGSPNVPTKSNEDVTNGYMHNTQNGTAAHSAQRTAKRDDVMGALSRS